MLTTEYFAGFPTLDMVIELFNDDAYGVADRMFAFHQGNRGDWPGAYDYFEMCVLFGLIRKFNVRHVIECAPWYGWTTALIRAAGNNLNHISFDIEDNKSEILRYASRITDMSTWRFIHGDFRNTAQEYEGQIRRADLIFIDADHDEGFARWYLDEFQLFDKAKCGALIHVHDIYPRGYEPDGFSESPYLLDWLDGQSSYDILWNYEMCQDEQANRILMPFVFLSHHGRASNPSIWLYKKC